MAREIIEIAVERGAVFRTFNQINMWPLAWRFSPKIASRLEYLTGAPKGTFLTRVKKCLPSRLRRNVGVSRPLSPSLEVFLHHDADRQPYKTVEMMELERTLGAKSSNYFFYERHIWDSDLEEYIVDVEKLVDFERQGFEIGYHLNAYELAKYDLKTAIQIMERDVAWFRSNFSLKTYVPHGGVRGPGGLNNEMMPQVGSLASLLWAYCRKGVYCDSRWSDGEVRIAIPNDPRQVIKSATHGSRIGILMHPQYYGNSLCKDYQDYAISKCDWWKRLWCI